MLKLVTVMRPVDIPFHGKNGATITKFSLYKTDYYDIPDWVAKNKFFNDCIKSGFIAINDSSKDSKMESKAKEAKTKQLDLDNKTKVEAGAKLKEDINKELGKDTSTKLGKSAKKVSE